MRDAEVRVQLPAGHAFLPAMVEAAEKYAARRGLAAAAEKDFCACVAAALDAVVTAEPRMIELVFTEGDGHVAALVRGVDATSSIDASQRATLGPATSSATGIAFNDDSVSFIIPRA